MTDNEKLLREALLVMLDQVDYTHRACTLTEAVGAVLPVDVIYKARRALQLTEALPPYVSTNHERDRDMANGSHRIAIELAERAVIDGERVTVAREDFEQALVCLSLLAGYVLAKVRTAEAAEAARNK
jgi:hypothetical protein